ncbi:hypothetical protein [Amycolatopsis kentuckyensis]|uniref:hypothetical protein n=1 Tax=Amycolatopsis kentuckyensis TaxID=218823 RepID=UPI001FC9D919|nr:hypothetical protein [Amycolatopsis kentuckyensis]
MAYLALTVFRKEGRHVPDDVAVVGFDDRRVSLSCHPGSRRSASRSRRWAQ